MGVRVRLRISIAGRTVEAVALANAGFEADSPQLLVPYAFLVRSGISPEDLGRPSVVEYDTAGGPVAMYVYRGACRVAVVEQDRVSREVEADLVVSPFEREVLMNDSLIEELGMVLLSPRSGLWRFVDDPPDCTRRSYRPQLW